MRRGAVWLFCLALLAHGSCSDRGDGESAVPLARSEPRIVGLVPVRNEARRIAFCLRALAMFTDTIVVLDDDSGDSTLAVVNGLREECRIERVIAKDGAWLRNETHDRNLLLDAGRAIGGTHFVVLDADEAFTSNLLDGDELRSQIMQLAPGESIALHWIQLWKSTR